MSRIAKLTKFGHKLDFLAEMRANFKKDAGEKTMQAVLLGDLNIAPGEHDVWSSKHENIVSHTDIERRVLADVQSVLDWDDGRAVLCRRRKTL